jgi:hypothetical protein
VYWPSGRTGRSTVIWFESVVLTDPLATWVPPALWTTIELPFGVISSANVAVSV